MAEDVVLFAFESNCLSVSKHTKYFGDIQPLGLMETAGKTHGDNAQDVWDRCSLNVASKGGEGRNGGKEVSSATIAICCFVHFRVLPRGVPTGLSKLRIIPGILQAFFLMAISVSLYYVF